MLRPILDACREPATVLEIAQRVGTSVPSAASLAVIYARAGKLVVVGERKTRGRPAKVYQRVAA